MLRLHAPDKVSSPVDLLAESAGVLRPLPPHEDIRSAVWIDLAFPQPHETRAVEEALGIELPTRADMVEIEASSRVYRDGSANVMNVLLVIGVSGGEPDAVPVSLILMPDKLITVRYSDPRAFRTLDQNCTKLAPGANARLLLLRLLDSIVDRTADILEHMGGEIDRLSAIVFGRDRPSTTRLSNRNLQLLLQQIGTCQFVLNKVHDSLVTLLRAHSFILLGQEDGEMVVRPDKMTREQLKSLQRDITSLLENSGYLTQNVAFLLDAAVGRISIEQNAIVKIFSVAAVIFLPPTLVASIYGMNFRHMPELDWAGGYPMAIGAMILSAILPYLYFKRKGWL